MIIIGMGQGMDGIQQYYKLKCRWAAETPNFNRMGGRLVCCRCLVVEHQKVNHFSFGFVSSLISNRWRVNGRFPQWMHNLSG
jgi:hypothetical protein